MAPVSSLTDPSENTFKTYFKVMCFLLISMNLFLLSSSTSSLCRHGVHTCDHTLSTLCPTVRSSPTDVPGSFLVAPVPLLPISAADV